MERERHKDCPLRKRGGAGRSGPLPAAGTVAEARGTKKGREKAAGGRGALPSLQT